MRRRAGVLTFRYRIDCVMTKGLYRLDEFRDSCGFGLIAPIKGRVSHELLTTGINALTCMSPQGAIAADGKTGDGCGLLIQNPDAFVHALAMETFGRELPERYGGSIMLSLGEAKRACAKAVFDEELVRQGLELGWREVSTDSSCLGEIAACTLPGSEEIVPADVALVAFGFQPSPASWFGSCGMETSSAGRVVGAEDQRYR